MIDKINYNPIRDILDNSSAQQSSTAGTPANNEQDASLQIDYDSLIEKATQLPPTDPDAVRKAQELLLSGELESPENIRAAAENIITFGI